MTRTERLKDALFWFRSWLQGLPGRFAWWVAFRLPKKVVYFAFIRLWAHGTSGDFGSPLPDKMTFSEACARWGVE